MSGPEQAPPGSEHKLITCILPGTSAAGALRRLKEELGVVAASAAKARGVGRLTSSISRFGAGESAEREVLTVVVEAARADEVFAFLYEVTGIDRPHGGVMYQQALTHATAYALPDVPEEG